MNALDRFDWPSDYCGSLELTREDIEACSHQGECDEDVRYTCDIPYVRAQLNKIDRMALRRELREYGAWDTDELQDHETNLRRFVWCMACNMREEFLSKREDADE